MPRSNAATLPEVEAPEVLAEVELRMADRGQDVPFFVADRAAKAITGHIQRIAAAFPDDEFVITVARR